MAKYAVQLTRTAQKQLDKLPNAIADEPRPSGCRKLSGRPGYRIRKGDYRIIYDVFDQILTVEVVAVGHPRDIYE